MLVRRTVLALALLGAAACGNQSTESQLLHAHHNLGRFNGCDPKKESVAVARAAGPYRNAHTVFLQDWVMVSVCHLDTLNGLAAQAQKPLTLYVQGLDTTIAPSGVDEQDGTLTFVIDRNEKNKAIWQPLLYDPLGNPTEDIHVSVGVSGEKAIPRAFKGDTTLRLQKLLFDGYVLIWIAFIVLVIAILIAGARSDLLRDGPTIGKVKQPLSLARTQMAWWFVLILTGYIFIWLVTGDRDSIAPSLLGLMGISAGTALAAVAIGSRGETQATSRRKRIDTELTAIADATKDINTKVADPEYASVVTILNQKLAELNVRRANLLAERATLTSITVAGKWWQDLITDDNGAVGLDRLQILVWTVVLGGIFLYSVLYDLTMPEFSNTLLALMGISSGTYIGFKLPAKEASGT